MARIALIALPGCAAPSLPQPAGARVPWSHEARGVAGKDHIQRFERADFDALRSLGARDFAYVPFASMSDPLRPEIRARAPEARDRELVERARASGLRVLLAPHLWIDRSWHGAVVMQTEADWRSFFAAYTSFVVGWARFAAENDVDALCIGAEFDLTLAREREWRALIAEVRAAYSGRLVYAAHWSRTQDVPFWDALDAIGVNAYFPLDVGGEATLEALLAAWRPIRADLERLSARHARPIVFTEIGYRPLVGALAHPWKADGVGELDLGLQARAYEAAWTTFADRRWFGGLYWWEWFSASFRARSGPGWCSYSPQGNPAEDVLRAHWSTRSAKPDG